MAVACVTHRAGCGETFDEVRKHAFDTVVAARRADSDHHPDRVVALKSLLLVFEHGSLESR
jgi:hypothetical protein